MSYITLKCKNCGASMSIDFNAKTVTCLHCGSTFLLSELFDEKDVGMIKDFTPEDLEKKANFTEAIKKGEVSLYQGDFEKAEQYFKKAIEIDEDNYKGYFGVIKAKTHNFNILPETDDYVEYSKITLNLVDKDDEIHIKSELQKLELLKREKKELQKLEEEKEVEREKQEKKKQKSENFLTKLICVLIVAIAAIVLLIIYLSGPFDKGNPSQSADTYEINNIEDFNYFLENLYTENLISSEVVLNTCIDLSGSTNEEFSPIGTFDKPFTGKFYGNGHTIKNFTLISLSSNNEVYSGFFGYVKGAEIYGLKLENVTSNSSQSNEYNHNYFGFIASYAEGSKIANCAVEKTCTASLTKTNFGSFSVGGIVGKAVNSNVSFCSSLSNITASYTNVKYASGFNSLRYYMGGIAGEAITTKLPNEVNEEKINITKFSNCYFSGNLNSNITSTTNDRLTVYTAGIVAYVNYQLNEFSLNYCFVNSTITSNVNAPNVEQATAGIVAHGATSNELSRNCALYEENKFIQNSVNLSYLNLSDISFNQNSISYKYSENELINSIKTILDNTNWSFDNPLLPVQNIFITHTDKK